MIGIMVVSHSDMALGTINTCDMILGNHDHCEYVCLKEGMEQFSEELHQKLNQMMVKYDEIIIISDLKGGTPYNQSLKYKLETGKDKVELICGFNFPMFAELLTSLPNSDNAKALAKKIIDTAKNAIELYEDNELENDDMFD